jgi:hypothetical protein
LKVPPCKDAPFPNDLLPGQLVFSALLPPSNADLQIPLGTSFVVQFKAYSDQVVTLKGVFAGGTQAETIERKVNNRRFLVHIRRIQFPTEDFYRGLFPELIPRLDLELICFAT